MAEYSGHQFERMWLPTRPAGRDVTAEGRASALALISDFPARKRLQPTLSRNVAKSPGCSSWAACCLICRCFGRTRCRTPFAPTRFQNARMCRRWWGRCDGDSQQCQPWDYHHPG